MRLRDSFSGAVAAGLGLALTETAAGLVSGIPSLIEGLGNFVIDNTPEAVKEWAIATFGTADKLVLLIGIAAVTLLVGAAVGWFARRVLRLRPRACRRFS